MVQALRSSLRARLMGSYAALTLLVLVTVNLLALTYLERATLAQARAALLGHARVVAGVSAQYLVKGHDYLEYIARDYGRQAGARILVLDRRGTVLQDSFYDPALLDQDLAGRPEVAAALGGQAQARLDRVPGVGRTLYAAAPVLDRGQVLGAVLAVQEVETLLANLSPVRRVLLGVSGAALLVAAAAGWALAAGLSRPVALLREGVNALARGDLARRLPVLGRDELWQLAAAFNALADRLARVEESRRRFVANAAHELRTPLAALKALVEPLLTGAVTDAREQAEFLQDIGREVDRLADLAADLLTLSELEARRPLAREPVPVALLIGEVRSRLLPLAREKGVAIAGGATDGLVVMGDRIKLERALYNLVHNAVTYSPPGAGVRVSAAPVPGGVRLEVQDQGPGIPAGELPRLFERFYRADPSRSRTRGGAGLGLAIVQEIVAAHGGRIHIESAPGEGTRVVVEIPCSG